MNFQHFLLSKVRAKTITNYLQIPKTSKKIPSTLWTYLSVYLTLSFPHLCFQKYSVLQFPEIYSVRFLQNSKLNRRKILWVEFTKSFLNYSHIIMVKILSFVELHPKTPRAYSALPQIEPVLFLRIKQNWL